MRCCLVYLFACAPNSRDSVLVDSTAGETAIETAGDSRESASDSDSTPTTLPCDTAGTWYVDNDADGYGTDVLTEDCANGALQSGDCDDNHSSVHPGTTELATSGRDDDCDGILSGVKVEEVPHLIFRGEPYYAFGVDVAVPGDLDGDGNNDLVVMDQVATLGGTGFVYFGPLTPSESEVDGWASADANLIGAEWDRVERVASAGDVDGDGFIDILVAGQRSGDGQNSGVVYLLRGPVSPGEVSLPDAARAYFGAGNGSQLMALTGPIDVNGDGLGDVVMGADDSPGHQGGYGDVFILRGPAAQSTVGEADTILHGNKGEKLASRLEVLGDVDGDGIDDLAVSRGISGDDTCVYVVLDMPPGTYHPSDIGVRIYTHAPLTSPIPNAVGDVNGDGLADVGVGGWGTVSLPVVFGPLGAEPSVDLPDAAGVILVSDAVRDYGSGLAWAVPLGDWDGDGHEDLAAGDASFSPPEDADTCASTYSCPGAVFLAAGPLHSGTFDLETEADWLVPTWSGGYFGEHLAAGSDLDGDGFPELVVGDDDMDTTYVIFGGGLF